MIEFTSVLLQIASFIPGVCVCVCGGGGGGDCTGLRIGTRIFLLLLVPHTNSLISQQSRGGSDLAV